MPGEDQSRQFIAYQIHEVARMQLQAAPLERNWMEKANQRFPYRCLPLNIANQHGWFLTCPCDFDVYWYGGSAITDLELRFHHEIDPGITSHFGYAVLTFSLPYIFRTPPGVNLWVKGPSNWLRDGVQPLEGVVETDWASSTFTMNWKVTRAFEWIQFRKGEPVCMVVPLPRGMLETLEPSIQPLGANPELQAKYTMWSQSRTSFLQDLGKRDPGAVQRGWQKDYFQGKTGEGTFDGHQTRLDLKEFPPLEG
jgi:hypothetical protein